MVNGTSTPSTVSPTSNQLASFGAQSYGYDAKGNTTTVAGTATYHYDAFNRMDSAAGMAYYVNPEGQRLRKSGAAGTSYFAPDSSGAMLAEYSSGGWIDYVWLNGRLIGRVAGGQRYAIHDDQTGRPEAVTNGSGAVVWRAQNFAFTQNVTNAGIVLNLGFPGQYYDAETSAWNNGFRDYKSALGRYVESDPIGLDGGVNTYAYAGGDPINSMDPSGLICISDNAAKVIGAAAGGGVTGALTAAANLKGSPWGVLAGGVAGAGFGAATQALSNWMAGAAPGNDSAAAGIAAAAGSIVQDQGNVGGAVANGLIAYAGDKMGFHAGVGMMMTSRSITYIGAATIANRGLGVGAFVAGPMFGLAGAFTDIAAENAAKSYSDCNCGK